MPEDMSDQSAAAASWEVAEAGARQPAGAAGRRGPNTVRLAVCFLAVAEEGHIGHAAEQLGMAQPPLSQAIRRFEQLIGAPVLVRHAKGVRLTEAGRRALPRARALVAAEAALHGAAAGGELERPPLVAVAPEVPEPWVLSWAGAAGVRIRRMPSREAVRALEDRSMDQGVAQQDGAALAVVVAPSLTGRGEAWPVVAIPQRLLLGGDAEAVTGGVDRQELRRLLRRPVASSLRSWQPAAHDLLEDELRSIGARSRPLVRQLPDRAAALAEALSGRAVVLAPESRSPAEDLLVAVDLPPGCLQLRLRVVLAPAPSLEDPAAAREAAERIVADLEARA